MVLAKGESWHRRLGCTWECLKCQTKSLDVVLKVMQADLTSVGGQRLRFLFERRCSTCHSPIPISCLRDQARSGLGPSQMLLGDLGVTPQDHCSDWSETIAKVGTTDSGRGGLAFQVFALGLVSSQKSFLAPSAVHSWKHTGAFGGRK